MGNFLVKEFRQRTGIRVTAFYGGTGELLDRLDTRENVSKADVFWGGGAESLEAKKYLFQPFVSDQKQYIRDGYASPENLWCGLSLMPMVIVYNTKLVPAEKIPHGWDDLLSPYFRNQIRMGNPETSGSSFSMLCTLLGVYGGSEYGWNKIRTLSAQLGDNGVCDTSETVYTAVSSGEAFAGLTYEDAVLLLKTTGAPVEIVYPAEGTAVVPDGIALIKNAKHPEAAKIFIEFALSRDVQSIVSEKWMRRSVRKDVDPPTGAIPLSGLKTFRYNIADTAARKKKLLEQWRAVREHI
jgi:iron(III) transport system substrate-binding protein